MKTVLLILGAVMILEGVPYFTMPDQVKQVAEKIVTLDSRTLRMIGFGLMVGGLALVSAMRP